MKQNFIERLTDEQIRTFLDRHYPKSEKYSYTFFKSKHGYIYVHIDKNYDDQMFNITLYDYDSNGCHSHKQWIKYLYEIFGEEYKKAYLEQCAEIFN